MSPPSAPQRNVRNSNPVGDKVEVLKELRESLLPMMRQIVTPMQEKPNHVMPRGGIANQAGKADRRANKENDHANAYADHDPQSARDERARRRARARDVKQGVVLLSVSDDNERDPGERIALGDAVASSAGEAANMAEVRSALKEVCEAEPAARSMPAVQSAYVALDNMEAEEVEVISSEAALLFKEQQNLIREVCMRE